MIKRKLTPVLKVVAVTAHTDPSHDCSSGTLASTHFIAPMLLLEKKFFPEPDSAKMPWCHTGCIWLDCRGEAGGPGVGGIRSKVFCFFFLPPWVQSQPQPCPETLYQETPLSSALAQGGAALCLYYYYYFSFFTIQSQSRKPRKMAFWCMWAQGGAALLFFFFFPGEAGSIWPQHQTGHVFSTGSRRQWQKSAGVGTGWQRTKKAYRRRDWRGEFQLPCVHKCVSSWDLNHMIRRQII